MALATYNDLLTQVANWIARSDLTTNIPDFVTLFEVVANRRLRTRLNETSTSLTTSAGAVALPSDYLTWRRMTWNGSTTRTLEYVHPAYLRAAYPTLPTDVPRVFTIEGSKIQTAPVDDTSPLTFDYFQKITALSAGNNWLMTNYPDAYLFGTLAEAYGFMKDPDNLSMWASRRDAVFDEITGLDQKTRGPSQVQVIGWTP